MVPPRDHRKRLTTQFFEICQDLKEVIEDRKAWHENGHDKDCRNPDCKEDPLYHRILDLNVKLAVARKKAEEAGVEREKLMEIEKFFGLRKGR